MDRREFFTVCLGATIATLFPVFSKDIKDCEENTKLLLHHDPYVGLEEGRDYLYVSYKNQFPLNYTYEITMRDGVETVKYWNGEDWEELN